MVSRWHLPITLVALGACKSLLGIEEGVVADGKIDSAIDDAADDDAPIDDAPDDSARFFWWDPAFSSRRSVTVDTTGLSLPIVNLPVLVRIPATIKAELLANNADIRFVADDHQTLLPFELEPDTSETLCWVKLSLTTANQRFWLYYGNATAMPTSNGALVFTDYVSVHHLASPADATANGHTLDAPGAGTPTSITAMIGRGSGLDGNNDFFTVQNSNAPYDFSTEMSASVWFRSVGFQVEYEPILTKGDSSWRIQRDNLSNRLTFATGAGGMTDNLPTSTNFATNTWHHILVTRDAAKKQLFLNGVLEGSRNNPPAIPMNNSSVFIGGNDEVPNRFWDGALDEIRVSATPRSAAWARAEYEMVANQGFVTFGARELHP